jgi:hypothetical protein
MYLAVASVLPRFAASALLLQQILAVVQQAVDEHGSATGRFSTVLFSIIAEMVVHALPAYGQVEGEARMPGQIASILASTSWTRRKGAAVEREASLPEAGVDTSFTSLPVCRAQVCAPSRHTFSSWPTAPQDMAIEAASTGP